MAKQGRKPKPKLKPDTVEGYFFQVMLEADDEQVAASSMVRGLAPCRRWFCVKCRLWHREEDLDHG